MWRFSAVLIGSGTAQGRVVSNRACWHNGRRLRWYLARFSYDVSPVNRQRAMECIRREVQAARDKGLNSRYCWFQV